jgi:hypothetical protein
LPADAVLIAGAETCRTRTRLRARAAKPDSTRQGTIRPCRWLTATNLLGLWSVPTQRHDPLPEDCVSRRSCVSRARENRTHGLKGGWGNGSALQTPPLITNDEMDDRHSPSHPRTVRTPVSDARPDAHRLRLAPAHVASAVRCTVDVSRPVAGAAYAPVQLVVGCGSDGDDDR